jgi:hypothetical protein
MDMQQQACGTLFHTFPLCSLINVWYILEQVLWVKQNPHFFEDVAQYPPHVMMRAGVTSELIIKPCVSDW